MLIRTLSVLSVLLICPLIARAQPFFGGGVSSFTPEISVVNSGVVNDVQPVVSPDRKYVTLNMRVEQSQLLKLSQYTFQVSPLAAGFVGGVQFPAPAATGAFGAVNRDVALAAGNGAAILSQRGMTRILGP